MRVRHARGGHRLAFEAEEWDLLTRMIRSFVDHISDWADLRAEDDVFARLESQMTAVDDERRSALIQRLFPDAYRGDAAAAAEFRRFTERDMARSKVDAGRTVLADLTRAAGGSEVWVPSSHFEEWVRTLTNLRLMLAVRHQPEFSEAASPVDGDELAWVSTVSDWLAWLLESMLA